MGTLICDLELGLPIDLLPDTVHSRDCLGLVEEASFHLTCPSRDGSSEHASAIKKGAPQALRSERPLWHLVRILPRMRPDPAYRKSRSASSCGAGSGHLS